MRRFKFEHKRQKKYKAALFLLIVFVTSLVYFNYGRQQATEGGLLELLLRVPPMEHIAPNISLEQIRAWYLTRYHSVLNSRPNS